MAKQRYINTKIWEDAWFSSLDQIEQLVFIYFLTNPMTNIIGAYELSKATITRSVGLDRLVLDELLIRFEKAKKVFYVDGWVVLPNFIKHQNYKSPKIKIGMESEMENVPEHIRKYINGYGMDTLSHLNSIKSNTNSIEYKKDTASLTPAQEAKSFFSGDFEKVLSDFIEKTSAPPEMLRNEFSKFILYWTERNKSGTKQRWEQQKTFEVRRRLATWLGNVKQFSSFKNKNDPNYIL